MAKDKGLGVIHISDEVIAEIAGRATLECYGVVGLGSPGISGGVAKLLSADKFKKSVRVLRENDGIKITLYVVAEYGTNLPEVAHNLMTQVKYAVERMVDFAVESVDVNIQSIKVSR
ncbi:MAG: Asp23/Gls24 family envelope stress response protein [Actinobacteria bacterium]|nr:Asp23/Gls24 family envelope stress response protein [Actinomycetota bacterium]